ncbi:MAG: family 20 glycosylhydrolase, partial [Cyclobacteriaceae bacterium]|nr:family 20 glycosylhydrolase [Cyclobacteriaceae bacterium]
DYLYCKSYCPLHPKVHDVIFPLISELVEVFEADAFHAGMDEVFYLGEMNCPRCSGKDKAELFAGEVTKIRNYLSEKDVELWIWGDRLLDGKTTGLGIWEASFNNTHKAIDLIPKDVFICDWHYEKAVPTAAIFAAKGLNVVSCPWRIPEVGKKQVEMMEFFRENSTEEMKNHFKGVIHTVWQPTDSFIKRFYSKAAISKEDGGDVETFKSVFPKN